MNADLSQILTFGVVAVLFATSALVLLVRGDLAPAGLGNGWGRVFLGAGIGLGVIVFTLKLTIISVLASFPGVTIDPLLPEPAETAALPDPPAAAAPQEPPRALWRALPLDAPSPPDNPTTPAKAALGERLFHDPALSRDGRFACASCHDLRSGAGADGRATAVGITGMPGRRNTPTVWNAAFQARLFWDGRVASLEEQATGPMLNPDEMGMPSLAEVERRAAADPAYRSAFDAAFGAGAPITIGRIAQAIAAFERTLVSADSPYDRFVRGEEGALSEAQKRGMWLLQAVGCVRCHSGPNFSGASLVGPRSPFMPFQVAGTDWDIRYGLSADRGAAGVWRVPSLRNVALTPPYFHNGAVSDLAEAVRIMAAIQLRLPPGGERTALWWQAEARAFLAVDRPVLGEAEIRDIVSFLHALSGDALAAKLGRQ